jgi:tetratricopeptide (TPR) repeat protein
MALRNVGDRAGSARLLERACAHPALSTYARLFVMHRLAKALEETGRYADAERLVAQVAAEPSPLRETAEKDQAWIGWIRGDGRRLLAWSLPNRTSPIGFHRAQALDLLGQFQMIQGDLAEAERCYRCLIDDTELDAAGILRDTGWRHLGMVVSWSRPLDAEAILDRALQLNEELGVKVGVAQTYIWRAVARTGLRPAATVRQLIDHGESLLGSTGGSADQWMVLMARLFLVAVDGADSEARAAAEALIAHVREQDCHPGLGEVAARWLAVRGVEVPPPATVEYWLDRDASLASWEGVLRERRDTRRR